MLIELMAQIMYHIEQTVGNQTSDYLASTDFKVSFLSHNDHQHNPLIYFSMYYQRAFQKDLTGCMLAPNLKSYVTTTIADITVKGTLTLTSDIN